MQTEIDPQEVLKAFYRSYADWLRAGAPEAAPYTRSYGLCTNLDKYICAEYGDNDNLEARVGWVLKRQFRASGLDAVFPFSGSYTYHAERKSRTQHLNPDRMAWVMRHETI